MKVFLSSVIGGMEKYRAAAWQAAEALGHTVVAAEDFRVSPNSPQQVCLAGVRDADLVVLLLGERYGAPQTSGLSPTHEEYHEARGTKPVFTFVQAGAAPEPDQEKFIEEVSTWEGGGYRQPFDTTASLASAVTRGLHEWELSQQVGPVNEPDLIARATALLPQRPSYSAGTAMLHVVVAGGPSQQVLRPGQLDDQALQRDLEQAALYGEHPIFDRGQGVQAGVSGTTLTIQQTTAQIALDEQGERPDQSARSRRGQEIAHVNRHCIANRRGRSRPSVQCHPLCGLAAGSNRPTPQAEPSRPDLPTGRNRVAALAHTRGGS